VVCDPDQVTQVLINLLVNARQALEATPQPRRIHLAARTDGDAIVIEVADNGPGVADSIRSRIFDPFFTTKPVGAGTGIGLAISRGIAEAHGGSLALAASDRGARFLLRIPLADTAPSGVDNAERPAPKPIKAQLRALIVDDEPEVGSILSQMLNAIGIHCDAVTSGETAIEYLGAREYDAIFCDVRLPGIDGPALYAWMADHVPHLCGRTAFVSGDTLGHASESFLAQVRRPLLEKPFLPADVRRLIDELLYAAPHQQNLRTDATRTN
jgi:CheY-like chemotaxis protein